MPATRKRNQNASSDKTKSSENLCSQGLGWDRQGGESHRIVLQRSYDDPTRGIRRIKLERAQASQAYLCRGCGGYLGCGRCLADISDVICGRCRDWGNDLSEQVHGPMVKNKELGAQGLKLVAMLYDGAIDFGEYEKLWNEARTVLR